MADIDVLVINANESDDELSVTAPVTVAHPTTFYSSGTKLRAPSTSSSATSISNDVPQLSSNRSNTRRSTRLKKTAVDMNVYLMTSAKKRAYNSSAMEDERPKQVNEVVKRRKIEMKDATAANNRRKDARDVARSRWLIHHRDLFEPLLPSGSNFFLTLLNNYKKSGGKGSIIPRKPIDTQPKHIKATMKDYQLEGLAFMVWMHENGMNCILGDEMGLGKTLQTLSLFAHIAENTADRMDPHLVICPLSVLSSWEAEAARWLPSFRMVRFHGPASMRTDLKKNFRNENCDILLTTYEAYSAEHGWFKSRRWMYCVLDEGHKIKNSGTDIASKLQTLGSLHRLILTGTPLQNNLTELWGLLHFLYPSVFTPPTEKLFTDSFDMGQGTYDFAFLNAAKNLLATIMRRRTKNILSLDIPPREEHTVFLPLSEAQRFWTYRILTRMDEIDLLKVFGNSGRQDVISDLQVQSAARTNSQFRRLQNILIQLRQVCNHPYLLDDALPEPYTIGEHIIAYSVKIMAIEKLLAEILPKGEKVLIFSQFTKMLDVLEDFMQLRSISYSRLDGSTIRPRRTLDIKLFQRDDSATQVYLISTRAGGLGINLTKATTVVMCDSDWNPQNDLQAIARAHRIGQTKVVKVYRLICRATVEDQMLDRIRRKLFLSVKVMTENRQDTDDNASLGMSELMDILQKGSSALTSTDDGMSFSQFLSASFNEVVEASKRREEVQDASLRKLCGTDTKKEEEEDVELMHDAEEQEKKLLSGVAQVKSRLFEGQLLQRSNQDIADEWKDLQKRAKTDRLVKIDGMTFELPSLSASPANLTSTTKREGMGKRGKKHDWEDYCIHCRDGGELITCAYCPRVFHAGARCGNVSKVDLKKALLACAQHICTVCGKGATHCSGMLFRCRTCPQAFCEDCLPQGEDEVEYIGDVIPEFQLLGFGAATAAYFVKCVDCIDFFARNPEEWEEWEEQFKKDEKKWRKMQLKHQS